MKLVVNENGPVDIVCETQEDVRSLVVHCRKCGSVHRYRFGTWQNRMVKAMHAVNPQHFLGVSAGGCSRCTADVPILSDEELVGYTEVELFTFA